VAFSITGKGSVTDLEEVTKIAYMYFLIHNFLKGPVI